MVRRVEFSSKIATNATGYGLLFLRETENDGGEGGSDGRKG